MRKTLGAWAVAAVAGVLAFAMPASALASCPNEAFRKGPSSALPDCRAYELVTPEDLGRTQSMTFTGADHAVPSADGEHLLLKTFAALEPGPSFTGTRAVFSRTATGWTMRSAVAPGVGGEEIPWDLEDTAFSPDLSHVAFTSRSPLTSPPPGVFEVGPVGGPYALVAALPSNDFDQEEGGEFASANSGTAAVPAFTHLLFESIDHELLPPGPERALAEETVPGAYDLYDWTAGKLRLVNVEGEGSSLHLVNKCGARAGAPGEVVEGTRIGTVSADGSKIFFLTQGSGADCKGPDSLFMRVDGMETVEVSAPAPGVQISERSAVRYNFASPDGSEVFFNTGTPLTGQSTGLNELFMYDTVTRALTLAASGVPPRSGKGGDSGNGYLLSNDASIVYYDTSGTIKRYDVRTGSTTFVATVSVPMLAEEPWYTTPDGRFLVFASGSHQPGVVEFIGPHGLEPELRGAGQDELYRYDAATGNVTCVSCGAGTAPAAGAMIEPRFNSVVYQTRDATPPFIDISADGQRAFFQTTAQLVPQDTNSIETQINEVSGSPGMDVYEWEAFGVEEEPGVFCRESVGCTHLLSSGDAVGPEYFLGASADGRDVFLSSAAQLLPQATPEFTNIYDARAGGGFASRATTAECLSCQGVGSPPPLFAGGASESFSGAGNPPPPAPAQLVTPKPLTRAQKLSRALRACKKKSSHSRKRRQSCERQARRLYGSSTFAQRWTHR